MRLLLFMSFVALLIVLVLKLVSLLLSESASLNREELSPFECGFEHHNNSRVPFSLRYFFLTLLFLLFDLEIILLVFIPYFCYSIYSYSTLLIVAGFLLFLFVSLIYE